MSRVIRRHRHFGAEGRQTAAAAASATKTAPAPAHRHCPPVRKVGGVGPKLARRIRNRLPLVANNGDGLRHPGHRRRDGHDGWTRKTGFSGTTAAAARHPVNKRQALDIAPITTWLLLVSVFINCLSSGGSHSISCAEKPSSRKRQMIPYRHPDPAGCHGIVGGFVAVDPTTREPSAILVDGLDRAAQNDFALRRVVWFEGDGHGAAHKNIGAWAGVNDQAEGRNVCVSRSAAATETPKPPNPPPRPARPPRPPALTRI